MNTQNFSTQTLIKDFVKENPDRAITVFRDLEIDYCCGGTQTLESACAEKELDAAKVLRQLAETSSMGDMGNEPEWASMSLNELVGHIVAVHHEYLNRALPEVSGLMEKVLQAHGKRHPELHELSEAYTALRQDLEPHMMKEEKILFPMIRNLAGDFQTGGLPNVPVINPIRVMTQDHEHAAEILERIKRLTNDFSPPEDGCETYKFLFRKLNEMVEDIHLHIYKENNLLFAGALEEAGITGS